MLSVRFGADYGWIVGDPEIEPESADAGFCHSPATVTRARRRFRMTSMNITPTVIANCQEALRRRGVN